MKRVLLGLRLAAIVGVLAAPCFGDAFTVVDGGKGGTPIIVPRNPAPAELFAAQEFQRYVKLISGVSLAIVHEEVAAEGPAVHVGATEAVVASGLMPRPRCEEDDNYSIRNVGDSLYVVGCRPRGTVYAVYDLLERLGCRWFAPGYRFYKGLHEYVPRRASLELGLPLDVTETPDFKIRSEFPEHSHLHEPDDVVALIDWCAKNRINMVTVRLNELTDVWYGILEPQCARRDLMLTAEAHGYDRFLSRTTYFPDHPEWFGPVDGEYSDHYFDQFTTTNEQALETFKENLREFVRRYPALYSVSAMPNDSPKWTDADLAAHSSKDLLYRMYDLICHTVYETNPEMKVSIGVGVEYFGVSGRDVYEPPTPNVTWHTAVLRRTQKYAWNDPDSELNHSQYAVAADVTKHLVEQGGTVVWDSRYAPFRDMALPGLIYPEQMAAEFRDLKQIGGAGVCFNYAIIPAWISYELKHILFARLLWKVDAGVDEIMTAYYRDRFPGSPDAMATFYTALRRAMERYEFAGGGYSREEAFGLYPEDAFEEGFHDLDEAQVAVDSAMAENSNDGERQLIWLLGASLEYARGKMEIDNLDQHGKREEARAKSQALMDYLEHWEGRGIHYDSSFVRMRLERRFDGRPTKPIKGLQADTDRIYEFKDFTRRGRQDAPPEDPRELNETRKAQ